jgi:hypothetical protein
MAWYTKWVIMVMAALVYVAGQNLINWSDLTASDWGTWIGAVGTVTTLAGTIYLATSETRRRTREDITKANIVASALAPRVEIASKQLRHFYTLLLFRNMDGSPYSSPREEAGYLLGIKYKAATTEELSALAAFDDGTASKLAYAQARLEIIQGALADFIDVRDDSPLTATEAKKWEGLSEELADRLDAIAARLTHTARSHAPPPTDDELYRPF